MTDRSALEPRRFEPDGPAAIDPRALARRWAARVPLTQRDGQWQRYGIVTGVAVLSVEGPLMQRGGWWDGYDSVCETARAAFSDPNARAVMLKLNSPGGVVAGCFEAWRNLRAMAAASGKPLFAFVDEQACSGAYALACAASKIYIPPSGEVGSVGVLSAVVSMKRGLEADGVDVVVIRSGSKKAIGHPYDALSEAAIAREQADVDALAAQFYSLVASARGMTATAVAALEGDTRMGDAAVAAGLADGVMTFDEAIRAASQMPVTPAPTNRGFTTMSEKFTASVLALTGTTDEDKSFGTIAAWKDGASRAASLEQELTTLRASQAQTARDAVIAQGVTEMKITPAQAQAAREGRGFLSTLSTEQLRAYVAEAVPVANANGEGPRPPAKLPSAEAEVTLTDEDRRQAKAMKISEADMLATKKELFGR